MKTKLLTIAMTAALMFTAMTKVQAQNFDGPCLPPAHGLVDHQSAFCGVMQAIALATGANYVSFFIDITLDDLKTALLATGNTDILIKSKTQSTNYQGGRWRGSLTWDVSKMYIIQVGESCEIAFEGLPMDPTQHPITVVNGSTYIGFPLDESMSLTNAFAGFAVNGDIILSKSGSAQYTGGRWRGTSLTNLEPGKGYIYKSSQTGNRTLVFPSSK